MARVLPAQRRASDPTCCSGRAPDRPGRGRPGMEKANRMMDRRTHAIVAGGLSIVLGMWLMVAPMALGYTVDGATWNSVVAGAAVALLAAMQLFGPVRTARLGWINAVVGLWLMAAPLILVLEMDAAYWNTAMAGLLVLALGMWGASATGPVSAAAEARRAQEESGRAITIR
jgi:hypothetical protein